MTKFERLKMVREALKFSQEDFANEIGISQGSISNYEIGASWPRTIKFFHKLKKRFPTVNIGWIESGEGDMLVEEETQEVQEPKEVYARTNEVIRDIQSIPLYDIEAKAGLQSIVKDNNVRIIAYAQIPNIPKGDGAVYAHGDSMYPKIEPGDVIAFKWVEDIYNELVSGAIHVLDIQFQGELMTIVKYVQKGEGWPETIRLASHNPYYQPLEIKVSSVKKIARAIGLTRPLPF